MENCSLEELNFFILIQALRYSTVGLKTFVDQCLKDLYDRLKRKVGSNRTCTRCCSKHCDVTQWCNTCVAWKLEIEKYMRYSAHKNKVQWRDIELWKLSGNYCEGAKVEMCRIFVRNAKLFKYDINNILEILKNCQYFVIDIKRLDEVRMVRNDFAHTDQFKMSRKQLEKAISTLLQFFHHPSLKGFQCISATVIDIKELLKKDETNIRDMDVYHAFEHVQVRTADIDDFLSISDDGNETHNQHRLVLILNLFVIILFIIWGFIPHKVTIKDSSVLECKTAAYGHPFTMEIDLDFYRSQHPKLIGRGWLLNELDEKMLFSKRGVLFLAEMGYGKSAIVSHLICQSDKRFPGNWIYQHIVVFHLCNFYSQKTLSPGNFINNLAGGFSKRIPGFLYILQQNLRFNSYFENRKCIEDPEGCLDFLVLEALNGVDMDNSTYIVLIDALDECIEYGERNIFNLLWKRFRRFPLNIKFLMTSRYTSDIKIAFTQLDVIEKYTTDRQNYKDCHAFLFDEYRHKYAGEQSNMLRLFESSDLNTSLAKAVKYAQGNILLIKNALPVWLQHDFILRSSYTTFEEIFEEQLTRIFRDRTVFKTVIKLFQVLCASMEPLHVEELIKIANLNEDEMLDALSIIGKELSHFIRRTNDKISLTHKSLVEYLTNESRKTDQFYVSKKDGCGLIGKYWLNILKQQKSFTNISVVDLASYIACSSDEGIKKKFLQYEKNLIKEFSDGYIFHQAAAKLNSYNAMSLILDLFSIRSVDETDEGNITASYVAAELGNHLSLKALLDRNANVNFIRVCPNFTNESVCPLQFCNTDAFWGYSLLNIAAQNGHYETVLTLLQHNVNISHQTSFGSNSFLLAVENGHTRLVREFLKKFKSNFSSSLNQALYLSSKNGYLDIVDLFLYHGADDL